MKAKANWNKKRKGNLDETYYLEIRKLKWNYKEYSPIENTTIVPISYKSSKLLVF